MGEVSGGGHGRRMDGSFDGKLKENWRVGSTVEKRIKRTETELPVAAFF
jgi:hypothetical protein